MVLRSCFRAGLVIGLCCGVSKLPKMSKMSNEDISKTLIFPLKISEDVEGVEDAHVFSKTDVCPAKFHFFTRFDDGLIDKRTVGRAIPVLHETRST